MYSTLSEHTLQMCTASESLYAETETERERERERERDRERERGREGETHSTTTMYVVSRVYSW